MFSIAPRDANCNVSEYQKLVIGQGTLSNLKTDMVSPAFKGLGNVRWSTKDVNYTDFDTLKNTLPAIYDQATGSESIDLSSLGKFPTVNATRIAILERGQVTKLFHDRSADRYEE